MQALAVRLSVLVAGALAGSAWAADPSKINWSKVPATTVTLFYPGQSSYEWLRGSGHPGRRRSRAGKRA